MAYPCMEMVKPGPPRADGGRVNPSRALALLAAFASPVLMVAAIAGWLYGLWPATPLTFAISAFAVVGGPLLGIVHVMTADEPAVTVPAPARASPLALRPVRASQPVMQPAPLALTPNAASAAAFNNWRNQVHPGIAYRERERRASQ